MPNIGDTVRYLNNVGGGKIIRIVGNMAYVDDEGFETPVLLRECVVVRTAEEDKAVKASQPSQDVNKPQTGFITKPNISMATGASLTELSEEEEPEEMAGGDNLNITLGFEPTDRSRLTQSDFDATLINDSNYYLYFTLSNRERDARIWTCRYAGIVEPNTELWLGTFERTQIGLFDVLCLQYVAFKRGKEYEMRAPQSIELRIDTTKFFKLHCFRRNRYFEGDVLAFDFVIDNRPANESSPDLSVLATKATPDIDKKTLYNNVKKVDSRTGKHGAPKRQQRIDISEPLVVDLHIDSLVDTRAGMSAADMLNLQVDTFRRIMDENLRNFGRKIIFIHGKGDGVLRGALTKELNHRYKGHDVQDASFQEYGYGATQVTIRQHPDKFPKRR